MAHFLRPEVFIPVQSNLLPQNARVYRIAALPEFCIFSLTKETRPPSSHCVAPGFRAEQEALPTPLGHGKGVRRENEWL
jgi:hypothetical protein